jgi:hypothetical protein
MKKKKHYILKRINPSPEEYTLDELSLILRTSKYTLRRRIMDGRLKAYKKFGKYVVSREEKEDFLCREKMGNRLDYFTHKGNLYKKEITDVYKLELEVKYLVEKLKVIALSDAAKIYYDKKLYDREDE